MTGNAIGFVRVCRQLNDRGVLLPFKSTHDIYDTQYYVETKPLYRSVFTYSTEQKLRFEQSNSVAGITDVSTNYVFIDLDVETNLDEAKESTLKALGRLEEIGIKAEDVDICFSGSKGFSITFALDKPLYIDDYQTFYRAMFKDLKGYDGSVVNANRIARVPLTKHEKTGLFKHAFPKGYLKQYTAAQIKDMCKTPPSEEIYTDLTTSVVDTSKIVKYVEKVKEQQSKDISVKFSKIEIPTEVSALDFKNKIKGVTNCRWAILNGFATQGNRHNQYMAAAAALKVLHFPKEIAFQHIKHANELNEKITNSKGLTEEQIRTDINSVYSSSWNNGQYSCKNEGFLRDYCQSLDGNKCQHTASDDDITSLQDVMPEFKKFASDFHKNIIKTGIPDLDAKCKFMAGTSSHILGSPGSGKCLAKGTKVRMYDGSLKNVEDVVTGDKLMGDDSTPRNVLGTCSGREEMFTITPEYGAPYTVNRSHILSVWSSLKKSVVDISIDDYLKSPNCKVFKGYWVKTEMPEHHLKVHPYIFGVYLSGCDMEFMVEKGLNPNVIDDLKLMGVWDSPHIPNEYIVNTVENRKLLVAGLLDGSTRKTQGRFFRLRDDHPQLEKDVMLLLRSLGGRMTQSKIKRVTKDRKFYKLYIPDMDNLISCVDGRGDERVVGEFEHNKTKIKVTSIGEGEYYGFEIDGNKRFLLEDFTVTHNTSIALQILEHNSKKDIPCLFFSLDMNKFNVITSIARRYFTFKKGEIDIYRDGALAENPDIEEMVMEHFNQGTEKAQLIEDVIVNKYKNVKFCFKPSYHVEHMNAAIQEASQAHGQPVKLVLVDYSELLQTGVSDPTQASAIVAQTCRHLAIESQSAFITLLQPNKSNSDVRKELTSYTGAKGSGAIAQSSQLMLSVSRPGFSPREPENDKYIVVNAVKNRSGALFSVDMLWQGVHGTITSLSQEQRNDLAELRRKMEEEESKSNRFNNEL